MEETPIPVQPIQNDKPHMRTSRLAKASLILASILTASFALYLQRPINDWAILHAFCIPLESIIIAAIAIAAIIVCLRGKRRGLASATIALALSITSFCGGMQVASTFFAYHICGIQTEAVYLGFMLYQDGHHGQYPEPNQWCDLLVKEDFAAGKFRRHPGSKNTAGYLAMNDACKYKSPGDTVLFFECKPGWNQHGGPELLSFDWHWPGYANVILNDGTLKLIRPGEEKSLRWSGDPNLPRK